MAYENVIKPSDLSEITTYIFIQRNTGDVIFFDVADGIVVMCPVRFKALALGKEFGPTRAHVEHSGWDFEGEFNITQEIINLAKL